MLDVHFGGRGTWEGLVNPRPNFRLAILVKGLSCILYMNKDLARDSTVWRALFGCGVAASTACFHVVKEAPKIVLRRMMGPVPRDGRSFRCCTVGELWRDCHSVSVMGVREKCDGKGTSSG